MLNRRYGAEEAVAIGLIGLTLALGFLVALACCATALGASPGQDDLRRIIPLGFGRSALAILLVNTAIDLVS